MALFSKDRILVPVDFSERSLKALEETVVFAERLSAVHAIHVLKPLEAVDPGVVWETVNDEQRMEKVQALFEEKFPNSEYGDMTFAIEFGDPTSEIIDYAEKQQVDLIVMPSRGRTGISRFFMGSIAERVIRFAHCPVLVLRQ